MNEIKAIETSYKGYRFRSRLEARWAIFFDTLGIEWQYEPQGFDLGVGGLYLPDFWLTEISAWFEVKGKKPTGDEHKKAAALAKQSQFPVVITSGNIGVDFCNVSRAWFPSYEMCVHFGSPGLFARHCLPSAFREGDPKTSSLQAVSSLDNPHELWSLVDFVLKQGYSVNATGSVEGFLESVVTADKAYYLAKHNKEHSKYEYGWYMNDLQITFARSGEFPKLVIQQNGSSAIAGDILTAFNAARSARFEHGETPAPPKQSRVRDEWRDDMTHEEELAWLKKIQEDSQS